MLGGGGASRSVHSLLASPRATFLREKGDDGPTAFVHFVPWWRLQPKCKTDLMSVARLDRYVCQGVPRTRHPAAACTTPRSKSLLTVTQRLG